MADELIDKIKEAADKPRRGKEDGLEIEERTIDEMIKADKYYKSTQNSPLKRGNLGFKIIRQISPGTQGN